MSNNKRGLGKGLNELLAATLGSAVVEEQIAAAQPSEEREDNANEVEIPEGLQTLNYLPVEDISGGPFQPRQQIHHDGLEQLAESIKTQGVLQPIVVRPRDELGKYEIVAGERRWRAAQLAGLNKLPAIIRDIPDDTAMALALIENIQREDLNPIEEAMALKRLADDLQLTHLQVAEAVGKSRTSVTNLLRLLTLNSDVQSLLEQGQLEMGHARALLALRGQIQSQVARTVAARGLSVRETERLVAKLQEGAGKDKKNSKGIDPNIRRLESDLSDRLGAAVAIRHTNKGQGTVLIKYNDVEELEGILAHFN